MATKKLKIELLEIQDAIKLAGGLNRDQAIAEGFDIPKNDFNRLKRLFNNGKNARSFDAMVEYLNQFGFFLDNVSFLIDMLSASYNCGIAYYTAAGWENLMTIEDQDYNDKPLSAAEELAIEQAEKSFLSDYSNDDIIAIERAEQAKQAAEIKQAKHAESKRLADYDIDSLADMMLGNIGQGDLMDIVKPMGIKKPELKPVKQGIKTMTKQECTYYIKALMYLAKWAKAKHYAKQLLNLDLTAKQRLVVLKMLDYCNEKIVISKAKKIEIVKPEKSVNQVIFNSAIAVKNTDQIINRLKKSIIFRSKTTIDYHSEVANIRRMIG